MAHNKKQLTQDERIGRLERVVTQLYLSYTVLKARVEKLEKPIVLLAILFFVSCSNNNEIEDTCNCSRTTYKETLTHTNVNGSLQIRVFKEQLSKEYNIGCVPESTIQIGQNVFSQVTCNK